MKVTRLAALASLLSFVGLVGLASGVGCEVIVPSDVTTPSCTMTQFTDPGNGTCPAGMYCEGAGCKACQAKDICDGYDNDCDGIIDDGTYSDHDGDGYTVCGKNDPSTGAVKVAADCNDDDKTIYPGATEICNGKDDNCDNIVDNPDLVCPPNETCVPTTGKCISNSKACVTCAVSATPGCCATPNVCDPMTQECVAPASQDAGQTGCTSNEQCTTGICATSSELGAGQQSVCTEPCCTSTDCPMGYVCYGPGTGGDYCVAAASVSRSSLGAGVPGAACRSGGDCRSGVCTNELCEDTCCSNASCTGGTSCSITAFGGATTFACVSPPGITTTGKSCHANSDCVSGFCQAYLSGGGQQESFCVAPCCGSQQCGAIQDTPMLCYDDYLPPATSGPVVPVCDYPQPLNAGNGTLGTSCTKSSDCASNRCLFFGTTQEYCTDVCCTDADCSAATGWVCRPTLDGATTGLRCVPPATQ